MLQRLRGWFARRREARQKRSYEEKKARLEFVKNRYYALNEEYRALERCERFSSARERRWAISSESDDLWRERFELEKELKGFPQHDVRVSSQAC